MTGAAIRADDANSAYVKFIGGQRLYFSSERAASMYRHRPRRFWLAPNDLPLKGEDGYRGLPDMHNQTVRCAVSNTSFVVKQMDSPRMMHKGGQFVFFCCNNCWMSFWKSPGKYILDSGINANAVEKIGLGGLKRADANTLPVVLISVVATLCIAICSHAITSKLCSSEVLKRSNREKYNKVTSSNNSIEFSKKSSSSSEKSYRDDDDDMEEGEDRSAA